MSAEGIRDGICTEANRPRFPTQEEPLLQVDTVRASDIAPEAFFDRYVKNRIPVKLVGSITDARWNGHAWLDLAYLDRKCGHCLVKVERRCERGAFQTDFGNGLEQQVCFSEFLNAIRSGDESYYLTTQQLGYSPEGEPGIVSAPLTELDGEFPWRPSLTGNLITQNINIWIGSSSKGTCSGLHHDHHDNLYILLNGEKSFKLFSPAELPNMYVHGSIARIHPNGRINYSGQLTRADGADVNSNRALRASMKLDQMACRADNDSDAEDEIDAALEDLLDAHMDCSENEDCSDSESADSSESEPADSFHGGGGASGLSDDADRMEAFFGLKSKATSSGRKRKIEGGSEDGGSKRARAVDASGRADDATEDTSRGPPANFSRVVSSLPEDKLRENFPKFLESRRRQLDVTLVAGEMLYLPCGWFHEVTSKSSQGASVPASQQFHMAVNYWFHPPDGDSFKSPYADTFWSESWKRRKLD